MPKKVVVAYSGGLDTSAVIPWLKEHHNNCEVICVVGDVGQGAGELEGIEKKAKDSGASSCHVVNLQREFVEDYVFPTFLAGAIYEGKYLLGTSIARPILAKAQVDVALKVGADAVAHGCTGKGNDQVRFEAAYAALAPHLQIIAPWRYWNLRSREDLLNYLKEKNVPTTASLTKIYSRDRNLLHISHEGAELEDPWNAPSDGVWMLTQPIEKTPNTPEDVMISFKQGKPVAVNEKAMAGDALLATLNPIGGNHGIGRIDIVENRLVGMKSRGAYETPGGTILYEAYRGLEQLVYDRETMHEREHIGLRFAELVYNGQWFTPLRETLSATISHMAKVMTGDVVVRCFKGHASAAKRRSPHSLYSESFATFGKDEVYNQGHSEGFIRLFSLPARIAALKKAGLKD